MSNDENRRATAVFSWAPGMLANDGMRADPGECTAFDTDDSMQMDTSDPATLGCMLAQVREAWGCPHIHTTPMWNLCGHQSAWGCWAFPADEEPIGKGATEAEALIAAMEAAQETQ